MRKALLLSVLLLATNVYAQSPPTTQAAAIGDAERRIVKALTTGLEYQIDVALPKGYATSQKRYPVVYTLDGNFLFPVVTSSYRLAGYLIPQELIVVGIGYPVKGYGPWSRDYALSRARDYTPTKPPSGMGTEGGASTFLRFLRDELIPFIDSNYRTVPIDRALIGHSYGGLFAAYALTHEPDLFQKYSIGDPSLFWDNEIGLRWEAAYAANHTELRARVYLYIPTRENVDLTKEPARRFWDALRTRHYTDLDLVDFVVVSDEIHTSVILGSIEHALRKLYARKPVSLPLEAMRRYIGEWKVEDQPAWAIRLHGDRLMVEIPAYSNGPLEGPGERRELLAESETSFFTELGDLGIAFTPDNGKRSATEMEVDYPRFGYHSVMQKVPDTLGNGVVKQH
jgi:predicted alpha/beta superfamily hydrolase